MHSSPTHHRAVAFVVSVAAVMAIARVGAPKPVIVPPPPVVIDAGVARIDPSEASAHALESLPGIGPSIAHRILEARTRGAVFRRPEDLLGVRGIGPRTLERLRPLLVFGAADAGATGRTGASPPR